jgi:hypothetical protein
VTSKLRARCGQAPIEAISIPESRHNARVRPSSFDEYVRQRRMTREQAWAEIRACWASQDAGKENPHRDCDSPAR